MDISFAFRKIQKSIAGLSILAVLTSLVSFTGIASADTFPDVDSDHYAYDAVDSASDEGWMTGYDNGDFGVDDTLTRGQAAKILVLGSDLETIDGCETDFTDVSTSYSLYDYVCAAEAYGFVGGYTDSDGEPTGEFGPDDSVNRAQFAKMVVEAFGLASVDMALDEFPDVEDGVWYEESDTWYVSTAWAWSVVNGYENGNYYPAYDVTRGQAAIMINNSQEPEWRVDAGDDDDDDTTSDGDLTVEVSSDSPDAMTIPYNATSVELAAWDFTANGGDVVIDSLNIHHYGVSTLGTSHQVYLYEGSTRLTSGTTISSTDNEATFTYDIEVAEGETRTITVRGENMGSSTATAEVGLEIVSASEVDAGDATVDGDFPAQGAKHTLSTTAAGTVTVEKNGNVDNAQVGEDGASIAKFKISSVTEAAGVEELGLYLAGSINTADVENFNLYVSGDDAEAIATVEAVDDLDVIRFDISGAFDNDSEECENSDGYCIAKGASKSFYVTADFNTGRTDDTVKVYVDQSTDVFARGALYGTGMSVTRTAYNGDTDSADTDSTACSSTTDADCSYSLLEGGDITISSNGPSAKDVATNARDVSVLDFSIVSVTDVTFDSFPITMDATEAESTEGLLSAAGVANFTDVKIVDSETGSALYAGVDTTAFVSTSQASGVAIVEGGTDDLAAYHLYTDDFEMEAGEELTLSLTVDIANVSTLDSMTFTAGLDLGTTYPQLKDANNKTLTNSSVLVPSSAITSKTMTVRTPSLALSLASTPGIKTWVKGAQDVPFSGLTFACGDSNDCRVTDLTLQAYYDDDANADWDTAADSADHTVGLTSVVGSVWLEDSDGEVIATAKSINSSTFLVVFDSVDWDIEAGETAVAYVHGNISTNASSQRVAFGISSAANVTVEDEDGNGFSATASGSTTGAVNGATPTAYVTAVGGGTLTVAVSSSTARENIVVAGASDVEIASYEFTSTLEAFTIENISLNNRQSAVTTAALGDYDDNVVDVTVEYEDEDGVTQTSSGTLTGGTATLSGLTFYVPADDSATMTVYADLNTISDGADAATFVDLAPAFNNFEALAESSGETYKLSKIDDDSDNDGSDLSFGTMTWTDGAHNVNLAIGALAALGTAQTIVVDNGAAATPENLPVGTLLCLSANTTCDQTAESMFVVTSWSEGTVWTDGVAGDSVATLVVNNDDTAAANDDNLVYSLPGTGYLTATNHMHVYESKPTLALASSSPSGSRSVSATDDAFVFSVTADSQEKIQIRPSVDFTTCVAGTGATITSAAQTTVTVDGSSCDATDLLANTDSVLFANTANLATYSYVSFWFRWNDDSASAALPVAAISVATADANDGTEDQTTATVSSYVAGSPTVFDEGTWYLVKDVPMPAGTDSLDTFIGLQITDATNILDQDADDVYIDQFRVYNEKIEVDISSDGDLDRTFNQGSSCATAGNSGCPVVVSLKESGNTIATGYVDSVAVDIASDGAEDATDGSLGVVQFIPTSTQGTIEIAKGTTKTYTTTLSTTNLLFDDPGVDDPLTFSIDLGSAASGTVTAGDLWWYETNATVRWVGNVSSTTLNSNTVKY